MAGAYAVVVSLPRSRYRPCRSNKSDRRHASGFGTRMRSTWHLVHGSSRCRALDSAVQVDINPAIFRSVLKISARLVLGPIKTLKVLPLYSGHDTLKSECVVIIEQLLQLAK